MEEPYTVKGDCLIIHFKEELDHHLTEQLRGMIDSIIEKRRIRYIVMDFENQSFMDSSGIGILLGRYKRMHHMGGEVLVTGEDAKIRRLLRISGVYQVVGTL